MKRALPAVGVLAAGLLFNGCLTLVRVRKGTPIDPSAVAAIASGTQLPEVLERLGAPLEVHAHPDGKLLVYRYGARNTWRLGIDPARAVNAVDVSNSASQALGNLRFTFQSTQADEDRVVIQFDRADRVRAVGYRAGVTEQEAE